MATFSVATFEALVDAINSANTNAEADVIEITNNIRANLQSLLKVA